ncbi:MAG: CcmD family protein [Bacteroidetes bacterium]|nr:CcmD family protein [Bacteroidota bacterium]
MQTALDTLSAVRDTAIALLDADAAQQAPQGIERVMLASDKLPVVLVVVLIIWFGLLFLLFRTDRRISRIEKELNESAFGA